MLKRLRIDQMAIIDTLEVVFEDGLTIITGETGAGKSLLLECIGLAFGSRVSPMQWLKHGASRGQVAVTFDRAAFEGHPLLAEALAQAAIDLWPEDTELTLCREMSANSSRYRLNGTIINREVAASLRDAFIQQVGQHEVHQLFSAEQQRSLLDAFGGPALVTLAKTLYDAFQAYSQVAAELARLKQAAEDREQQLDWLRFQIDEIESAAIDDVEEDDRLKQQRLAATHHETLLKAAYRVNGLIYGDQGGPDSPDMRSLFDQLDRALASVDHLAESVPQLVQWRQVVDEARQEVEQVGRQALGFADSLSTEPLALDELVERIDTLEKLKRKYGGAQAGLAGVQHTLARLQEEYAMLQNADVQLAALQAQRDSLYAEVESLCLALTDKRRAVAQELQQGLAKELAELELPHARFEVAFEPIEPSAHGAERIGFLFCANPGEPLRPLQQIASGGELARILLALKVLNPSKASQTPVILLDEADTGMSGVALRAVAEKLAWLGRDHQLLVVTHQPLVACQGRQHLHLTKAVVGQSVQVMPQWLATPAARVDVLSRLASGLEGQDENLAAQAFMAQLLNPAS
ncbi:MAG: DNA repair protein RecN [Cyanobacteria bacterium HKST-UBA04]|nr:DNA repair protein RecN [Cyanobacteria bacterium HKST-UBA04]